MYSVSPDRPFTIGREGDLELDLDNPLLPRRLFVIKQRDGLWWLNNVDQQLSADICSDITGMQAKLSPGDRLPVVFPNFVVSTTAGNISYDFEILCGDAPFRASTIEMSGRNKQVTFGTVPLTADQRLLIVALAENALRNMNRGAGSVPTSKQAAMRLGWTITKFNRKLDNVCGKFEHFGVDGLHGGPSQLALSRKARLVEYAVDTGIVTRRDLKLLTQLPTK